MKEELWYYAQGKRAAGPVRFEKLQAMAAAGDLSPDDLFWHEGMDNWVAGREVVNLFSETAPASPPPDPHSSVRGLIGSALSHFSKSH